MSKDIGRLLTAMVTPFKADGSVDYKAARELAAMLVADGSDGVVVSGTTGESPSLTDAEKIELVSTVKEAIPGKNVVAGTGSNDTHHSVELSKLAMKAGADALLAVGGYGVICVVSHIAGRSMAKLIAAHSRGDNEVAQDIHHGLLPVIKALMTTAANPVPIKSVLNEMGFRAGPFRLPLVPLTDEQQKSVMKTIRDAGEYITFAKPGVKVA